MQSERIKVNDSLGQEMYVLKKLLISRRPAGNRIPEDLAMNYTPSRVNLKGLLGRQWGKGPEPSQLVLSKQMEAFCFLPNSRPAFQAAPMMSS